MNKVDTNKHGEVAVLIYLFLLLFFVVINLINKMSYFDLGYLIVVLCCVLKYLLIIRDKRK